MIKTEGWAQSQKPDQQVTAVPKVMIPTQTVLLNSKREKQNVPGEGPFQTDNSQQMACRQTCQNIEIQNESGFQMYIFRPPVE